MTLSKEDIPVNEFLVSAFCEKRTITSLFDTTWACNMITEKKLRIIIQINFFICNSTPVTHPVCPDKSAHPPLSRGDFLEFPSIKRGYGFSRRVCYFHTPLPAPFPPDLILSVRQLTDRSWRTI